MSQLYPDLDLTNFPNSSDHRYIMVDPSAVDIDAINTYNACISNGDMSGAVQVLENSPRLEKMFFNAEKYNRHEDQIIALQRFWHSNIQQYLVNIVVNRGEYSQTVEYHKYNVVQYEANGAKQSYMAIIDTVPVGTPPTDPAFFVQLTLRGEKGESGVGLSWRGAFDESEQYYLDDCVSYDNQLWVLINEAPIGTTPSKTESGEAAYWDIAFDLVVEVEAASVIEDEFHRFVKIGKGKENRIVVPNQDGDLITTDVNIDSVWHGGNMSCGIAEPSGGKNGDVYLRIMG